MLVGTYYHTLEAKGRFSLPKAFRSESPSWVLTAGFDGCLYAYRASDFENEVAKMQKLSYFPADHRAVVRHLVGTASPQTTDNLGRLTVPTNLQALAGLHKKLVIVGQLSHLEIWDADRYRDMMDRLEMNVEERAELVSLGEG